MILFEAAIVSLFPINRDNLLELSFFHTYPHQTKEGGSLQYII